MSIWDSVKSGAAAVGTGFSNGASAVGHAVNTTITAPMKFTKRHGAAVFGTAGAVAGFVVAGPLGAAAGFAAGAGAGKTVSDAELSLDDRDRQAKEAAEGKPPETEK